jgi:endonuclease/exonuclease/phosphatase family metal-dependent hydrolase
MKKITIILILLFCFNNLKAENFEGLSYGTDTTFDIGSWNLKDFPFNGNNTISHLNQIINKIDLDIIAIQEIKDTIQFNNLLDLNPNYIGYAKINYMIGLGFIVKKDLEILEIKEIFNSPEYWTIFPRAPMILEVLINKTKIIIINNHLKCCGDGNLDTLNAKDEEFSRLSAIRILKEYIEKNYKNEKVIILGDFNDILDDKPQNNVFKDFINDSLNYLILDHQIALKDSTNWSYPSWPSHIDHVIINNKLLTEFNTIYNNDTNAIQVLAIDRYYKNGFSEYSQNISDHRPIVAKFDLNNKTSIAIDNNNQLSIYPNPTQSDNIKINIEGIEYANITIIDILGNEKLKLSNIANKSNIDISPLENGIYLIQINSNNKTYSQKLIVNR